MPLQFPQAVPNQQHAQTGDNNGLAQEQPAQRSGGRAANGAPAPTQRTGPSGGTRRLEPHGAPGQAEGNDNDSRESTGGAHNRQRLSPPPPGGKSGLHQAFRVPLLKE